jgi:hypothetical protein
MARLVLLPGRFIMSSTILFLAPATLAAGSGFLGMLKGMFTPELQVEPAAGCLVWSGAV